MARFSNELLDLHVAPRLSELISPVVPPLTGPKGNFGSWFLNNTFTAKIKRSDVRILMSIFINRTEFAYSAYERAREKLDDYVSRLPQANNHFNIYREALRQFETCILHANIAFSSGRAFTKSINQVPIFEVGDKSPYDRLRDINNRIKHFDEDITEGKDVHVVPAWLTNDGIECSRSAITYAELAMMLNDAATDAKHFAETIFRDIVDRHKATNGGSETPS